MKASSNQQNPFDFSNPVTEKSVLAGRDRVLEQAFYYLDQSREGGSYSLALIGERASGKTSLLNALHQYAAGTELVAAQVRLDEGIAADDLDFFREVFHSLMSACADKGLFGGEGGAEYDTFRRQILTHDLDTDRSEEPLAFGRVYATARAQDRDIPLSRRMLLEDLEVIVARCRSADITSVVLLLDEGDVLAENHPLLQALRNLLMDSSNFSIVTAGTEHMFPAISEVFSPVPRQFVRINVGPLESWHDTRKAILRRLILSGKDWAMPTAEVCQEIHTLTQGKPYEVMLVSHFAYRERTRERQRVPMAITPEVMNAVANQLEQQNPSVQKTLLQLRALAPEDAETIRELLPLDGLPIRALAIDRMDLTNTFSNDALVHAEQEVQGIVARLTGTGFVSVVDGTLHIDADSFQKALIKYVVLGKRGRDSPSPLLGNPRYQVAQKARNAIERALSAELSLDGQDELISEIHPFEATTSRILAFSKDYSLEDYPLQASCRIKFEREWTAIFVFKGDRLPPDSEDRILSCLDAVRIRLSQFDIELTDLAVSPVDKDAILKLRTSDLDPLQEVAYEAQQAFTVGSRDFREQVTKACEALATADAKDDAGREDILNNCAFMALAVGDSATYRNLSDRAEALENPHILTVITKALWEATEGQYDGALERLNLDDRAVSRVGEHNDVMMYSPALLARHPVDVGYEDLVGDLKLSDVVRGYQAAISAKKKEESVADSLAAVADGTPWLLGAAADAAAAEGRPEAEEHFRRMAAESVGGSD